MTTTIIRSIAATAILAAGIVAFDSGPSSASAAEDTAHTTTVEVQLASSEARPESSLWQDISLDTAVAGAALAASAGVMGAAAIGMRRS